MGVKVRRHAACPGHGVNPLLGVGEKAVTVERLQLELVMHVRRKYGLLLSLILSSGILHRTGRTIFQNRGIGTFIQFEFAESSFQQYTISFQYLMQMF